MPSSPESDEELAAVDGEAFFQSLLENKNENENGNDGERGIGNEHDNNNENENENDNHNDNELHPELEAEIASELQIEGHVPAVQIIRDTPAVVDAGSTTTPAVPETVLPEPLIRSSLTDISDEQQEHQREPAPQQQQQQQQQQQLQPSPTPVDDGFSPAAFVVQPDDRPTQADDSNLSVPPETVNVPSTASTPTIQPSSSTAPSVQVEVTTSTGETVNNAKTSDTTLDASIPPSVPSATPVEYYLPNRVAHADSTTADEQLAKTDWQSVPPAINTDAGLGIHTELAESPAIASVVAPALAPAEDNQQLGELPKTETDTPALYEETAEGGGETQEAFCESPVDEAEKDQVVQEASQPEADLDTRQTTTAAADESDTAANNLEDLWKAMGIDDSGGSVVEETNGRVAATDETAIPEEDLEERWKAMGFDDAELLDDLPPEELEEVGFLQSQPLGNDDVPQSADITTTTATPYLPSPQPPPTATYIPIQPQSQFHPQSHPPANPYVPEGYQAAQQQPVPTPSQLLTNAYAPHQPSSSALVQGLPVPTPYSSQNVGNPASALTSGSRGTASTARGPESAHAKKPSNVPSFVDKAKEGYQSPYDLPEEFLKPVKRVASVPHHVQRAPSLQLQQPVRPPNPLSPSPLQQPPRPHSVNYKPTSPPPKTAPAPIFAPRPPASSSTIRHAAKISPPPSAGNFSFPSHISGDGKAGFSVNTAAAANAATAALVPSPPVTPPMTGGTTTRSLQSSVRSRYSPQPLQSEQVRGQGQEQASIASHQPGFAPGRRSPHARFPSHHEQDTSVNLAATRLAPPHVTATYRVPSPASIAPQAFAQQPPLNREPFTEPDYIAPEDGREYDPLQRWKGAPVFKFGFGGFTCSTFPRLVPKYLPGYALPKIKPMPDEVHIRKAEVLVASALQSAEAIGFPGPLTSKSKKKDVIAWMTHSIAQIEEKGGDVEEALLWKVMLLYLEHDGVLNGTAAILNAVCDLISPGDIPDTHVPVVTAAAEESVSPDEHASALTRVRAHLMAGLRETAVWEAADSRLWGHALLLSSSLEDKSVWKRVSEEFVQREMNALPDAQPLASLYEVLAGNSAECVDQLVPPSARAGLQMMDKTGSGSKTGMLDGLDKWRETVVLIIRNMSSEGPNALIEISRLLASFGRVAASHICALLAGSFGAPVLFSGPDDPQSTIALLGWDHRRQHTPAGGDLSSILLTEVYEFATTVLNTHSAAMPLPYLQAFKLIHAERLAEMGDISRALQYCGGFAYILKKTGHRPSPYYHALLVAKWEDLHNRLTQLSPEGISAWMSKPNMSKVSGSVWAKFQSFIAGEDVEDSPSSRSEELGILSSASLHTISAQSVMPPQPSEQQQQQQQMYGSPLPSPSIYSSQRRHTPASSSDMGTSQRFGSSNLALQYTPTSYIPRTQTPSARTSLDSSGAATSTSRYIPTSLLGSQRSLSATSLQTVSKVKVKDRSREESQSQKDVASSITNTETLASVRSESVPQDTIDSPDSASLIVGPDGETIAGSSIHSQPEDMGYMPPTTNSPSESPSSSTETVEEEEDSQSNGKKRSPVMEDDEDDADLLKRAAALKESEEKLRRKEEKEKKAQQSSRKKGWFSGWFGGGSKKEGHSSAAVTRAKLGEENSFYYDKDLKRWVNKKDPGAATAATATLPPPPKASVPSKRETGSDNISSTPSVSASVGAPPVTAAAPPPPPPPPQLPKSTESKSPVSVPTMRSDIPPSSSSVASATDAASAPIMPRNIGEASSLDDLLNTPAPVPRVHTTRSRRKGRGYVDLMAK